MNTTIPLTKENDGFSVTASLGIAKYSETDSSLMGTMALADEALCQVKKQGRNQVIIYQH